MQFKIEKRRPASLTKLGDIGLSAMIELTPKSRFAQVTKRTVSSKAIITLECLYPFDSLRAIIPVNLANRIAKSRQVSLDVLYCGVVFILML